MKKHWNKNGVTALALASIVGMMALTGCGGNKSTKATYTYHDAMTNSPETWDPSNWETNTDSYILNYTTMGFYDFVLNEAKNGYDIIPEMASGEPTDLTDQLTDEEVVKYGLKTNGGEKFTAGQKWVLNLNDKAAWEDGTPINADTYIESMKRFLDPKMQNFRASNFYANTFAFGNAEGYAKSGLLTDEYLVDDEAEPRDLTPVDSKRYFNLWGALPWGATSVDYGYIIGALAAAAGSAAPKVSAAVADTATYGTQKEPKYVEVTAANREAIAAICEEFLGLVYPFPFDDETIETLAPSFTENGMGFGCFLTCKVQNPEVPFSDVGLVKTGEHQLTLYLLNPVSEFQFKYNMSSNWLLKDDIYDACKKTVGSLVTSTYGQSKDKYMSYGPYKIESYQADKGFKLTRNDKWYGYTDGQHNGQFTIDGISVQILANDDTIKNAFLKGDLDGYGLRAEDLETFGSSTRFKYTPQSYTTKITMNSNFNALKGEQDDHAGGTTGNHTIMANVKFRQALSLAIDRQALAQSQTAGSRGFDVPINFMYVADEETGIKYRDTEQGKKVVTDNFGTTADGEPNYIGFDLDKARALVDEAVDEEIAKSKENPSGGFLGENDSVTLYWEVYNAGWDTMITWIVNQFTTLMQGTKLEGKFSITTNHNENYDQTIEEGNCDLAMSTWGGSEFDPYGIMQVYFDPEYKYEPGIDSSMPLTLNPSTGEFAVTAEEKAAMGDAAVTKTLYQWQAALISGDYSAAVAEQEVRLNVLSALENWLVGTYNFASIYARQSVSLDSYRYKDAAKDYVTLVGFGGIRNAKLTMSDSEWANWVAKNSKDGKIDYNR